MKQVIFNRTMALAIVLGGALWSGTGKVRADVDVSADIQINAVGDFDQPLATEGAWVDVGNYGRCWYPGHVAAGWRPYCEGSWVWTDSGWYWQSDEPWAWACYHYGSWAFDSGVGWVWIPGTEWAPAWVTWREGGGHIGWAPCGPRGAVVSDDAFVFCDENHFQDRHRASELVVNNATYVHDTTVINASSRRENRDINGRQQSVVVNNGPDVSHIEKASGKKFQPVPIGDAASHTTTPHSAGHTPTAPAQNTPVNREPPLVAPEHKTPTVTPEVPNQHSPPEQKLPEERREVIPPNQSTTPEVPVRPEPQPVEPRHDLVPPTREVPPVHEVPPTEVPAHQAPPAHEVPPTHEVVPQHQAPPHEAQPVHPPTQEQHDDKKDQPSHE